MVNSRFFWPTTKRLSGAVYVSVSLVGGYLCRYLSTKLAKHIDNGRRRSVTSLAPLRRESGNDEGGARLARRNSFFLGRCHRSG